MEDADGGDSGENGNCELSICASSVQLDPSSDRKGTHWSVWDTLTSPVVQDLVSSHKLDTGLGICFEEVYQGALPFRLDPTHTKRSNENFFSNVRHVFPSIVLQHSCVFLCRPGCAPFLALGEQRPFWPWLSLQHLHEVKNENYQLQRLDGSTQGEQQLRSCRQKAQIRLQNNMLQASDNMDKNKSMQLLFVVAWTRVNEAVTGDTLFVVFHQ